MSTPKRTWKYKSQFRLTLPEREYLVVPRKTDYPNYYVGYNSAEMVKSHWRELKELCGHRVRRVMFTWLSGNESKMHRRVLDLVYRLTMRKTIVVGVFEPARWYIKRKFDVRVYPTILWLGWEGKWVEYERLEGSNFTVREVITREVEKDGKIEAFKLGPCSIEEKMSDRWEQIIWWLSERRKTRC